MLVDERCNSFIAPLYWCEILLCHPFPKKVTEGRNKYLQKDIKAYIILGFQLHSGLAVGKTK
jgi:hypothetical protein